MAETTELPPLPPPTGKRREMIDSLADAINDFINRGPFHPDIVMLAPTDYEEIAGKFAQHRYSNFQILGVEIDPDPRVAQGVAVACDVQLKWLGAFSYGKPKPPPVRIVAMTQEEWDSWNAALDRKAKET